VILNANRVGQTSVAARARRQMIFAAVLMVFSPMPLHQGPGHDGG
jgi:hypothetical protein